MSIEIIDYSETIAIGKLRSENSGNIFASYRPPILDMDNEWKLLNYLVVINAKNKFKNENKNTFTGIVNNNKSTNFFLVLSHVWTRNKCNYIGLTFDAMGFIHFPWMKTHFF
ncbi:MAG: hypothetical protein IPI10_19140 [Bacteroidetes bacterium]|nr:hypothetical protein [Bacteroidota bacterium]